jgi:hypothetical protein
VWGSGLTEVHSPVARYRLDLNGFAYLIISFTGLLLPLRVDRVTRIVSPALLGEGAIILWLLIKGAKPQPLTTADR